MQRALYLCHYYLNQVKVIHTKTVEKSLPESFTRIIGLSQEIGKVTDRVLVQKHWVSSAKEAREIFAKLSEMGVGIIHKEGRVSESFEVVKKDSDLYKHVDPPINRVEPINSKSSTPSGEVFIQNRAAVAESPKSDPLVPEVEKTANTTNGAQQITNGSQRQSGKGFAPQNNGSTVLNKNQHNGNGSSSGLIEIKPSAPIEDLPEIDLRSYGIDPDEWQEY
jgi:hypothetical protein